MRRLKPRSQKKTCGCCNKLSCTHTGPAGFWLASFVSVLRPGSGLQRSAVSAGGPALSLRLHRCRSCRVAGSAHAFARSGDGLGSLLGAVSRDAGRLALQGDHTGRGADRGRVVQFRARPGAMGELCRVQLHRPPAHRAQGGQPGPALHGAAFGRTPCGAIRHDGCRGRDVVMGWTEDLAASAEAFAGQGPPPSGISTVIEDWG